MTRRFALLLLLTSLLVPLGVVQAQAAPALASLQISFWPEYDQPATLVIYRGVLSPETPLPASLRFTIPAKYGPPLAVAFSDEQGQLLNLEHTTTLEGENMVIVFDAPTDSFQFEYYDTSLDTGSDLHSYSFATIIPYAINTLSLQVQQPVEASSVSTTPELSTVTPGGDGLTYHEGLFTEIAPNTPITLSFSYSKSTDALSASAPGLAVTPQLPPLASDSSSLGGNTILLAFAGVAGLLLVAGGVVWYLQTRSQGDDEDEPEPQRRRKPKGQPPRPRTVTPTLPRADAASEPAEPAAFCHNCGQKSLPDDRFCRSCGTELRREE